jgi:hypothetical protein
MSTIEVNAGFFTATVEVEGTALRLLDYKITDTCAFVRWYESTIRPNGGYVRYGLERSSELNDAVAAVLTGPERKHDERD